MRILITGGSGVLGLELKRGFADAEVLAPSRADMDITRWEQVRDLIETVRPDILVHSAAYTDVDRAEDEPDKCFKVNVAGMLNLLRACRRRHVRIVYVSSTGIYGHHEERPYCEYDIVAPTTVYHRSKWEAEKLVRNHCPNSLVLRIGWLFGGPAGAAKNFVYKRFLEASAATRIVSDPFQKGNPTWTRDVVRQIRVLLEADGMGTYNCVGKGVVTRFEYVREIVDCFRLSTQVVPTSEPFQRKASVSPNESARNLYLELVDLDVMPDFRSSLHAYVGELQASLNGEKVGLG